MSENLKVRVGDAVDVALLTVPLPVADVVLVETAAADSVDPSVLAAVQQKLCNQPSYFA
jgi:hypothetical protein